MKNTEIIAELRKTIAELYAIRLPAQELQASSAIMAATINLNVICKKLTEKEEPAHDTDNQPE